MRAASASLCDAVHAARGLVEQHGGARRRPPSTTSSASRWRSPPDRSRGFASPRPSRPAAATPVGAGLLDGVLVDQVVARVLEQQRHLAGALDAPARRLGQPLQRGAAACSCRRRCGPSARPARRARARGRGRAARSGRPRSRARRRAAPARARAVVARAAARSRAAPAPAARPARSRPTRASRSPARASLTDAGSGRARPARTGARPGVASAGVASAAQARKLARRRRRRRSRALDQRDHAVGRRQAALEPVLGDHHGRAPVLVQPPQQPDQLVARDRVELRGRLVEQQQRAAGGPARRRSPRAAARRPRACRCGARAGAPMPSASAISSTARATAAGGSPRCSSGSASSARTPPITTCVSGLLEDRAADGGQLARAVLAHVEPADRRARPLASPPWKCGHEPAERAQQRRLARARHAGQHREGARLELERDVAQRAAGALRVAVAEAVGDAPAAQARATPSRAARPAKRRGAEQRPARPPARSSAGPSATSSVG